jgi:transcription-repair coupling factor (superfamily II helicase)
VVQIKGALLSFRHKKFANPQRLVKFMHDNGAAVKLQPDHKLVYRAEWEDGARAGSAAGVQAAAARVWEAG